MFNTSCFKSLSAFVDDSGRWGSGGLFSALSTRSLKPEEQYKVASKMRDLALGDTHLVPIDDIQRRDVGTDYVSIFCKMFFNSCHIESVPIIVIALQLFRLREFYCCLCKLDLA